MRNPFDLLSRALLVLLAVLLSLLAVADRAPGRALLREARVAEKGEAAATAAAVLAEGAPLVLAGGEGPGRPKARQKKSQNVVVDTLNLAHWLGRRAPGKRVETCDIIAAIDETAPLLRRLYPDRVIYVTKGREARAEKRAAARLQALYQAASRRNGVYIHLVERLPGDGAEGRGGRGGRPHAALGRDDFYLILLAWKLGCPVLSRDRFRDLKEMKAGHLARFHVRSYSPVKRLPTRDFVNPAAAEFRRLRRPPTVDYTEVFPHY
jgi:hypothetical protein